MKKSAEIKRIRIGVTDNPLEKQNAAEKFSSN